MKQDNLPETNAELKSHVNEFTVLTVLDINLQWHIANKWNRQPTSGNQQAHATEVWLYICSWV